MAKTYFLIRRADPDLRTTQPSTVVVAPRLEPKLDTDSNPKSGFERKNARNSWLLILRSKKQYHTYIKPKRKKKTMLDTIEKKRRYLQWLMSASSSVKEPAS